MFENVRSLFSIEGLWDVNPATRSAEGSGAQSLPSLVLKLGGAQNIVWSRGISIDSCRTFGVLHLEISLMQISMNVYMASTTNVKQIDALFRSRDSTVSINVRNVKRTFV